MDLMADFKLREQDDGTVSMSLTSLSPGLMRGGRHGPGSGAQSLSESGNYQGG